VIGHTTDSHGKDYFKISTPDFLNDDVRYYYDLMDGNPMDFIGELFEAELIPTAVLSVTGRFYRVYGRSVEWFKEEEAEPINCAWCMATVDTKGLHGKCPDGSLLCKDCASDEDVKNYVTVNVVNP